MFFYMDRLFSVNSMAINIFKMSQQKNIWHIIASGLGSGYLPKAPGTWGSLAVLAPVYVFAQQSVLLWAVLCFCLLGFLACFKVLQHAPADADPAWIVIDEWAGQGLCVLCLSFYMPIDVWVLCSCFLAFRGFDIFKPWPIATLEHWGPAWWAVMFDDLIAGLMAAAVLLLFWSWF